MPSRARKSNKRTELEAWLSERRPARVEIEHLDDLRERLAPVSLGYLRRLLRNTGTPLAPLVEGVRQDSPEELERTLLGLQAEYSAGYRAGPRRLVIEAKDHARLSLHRLDPPSRAVREEMILWMLTWLESPEAFPVWLRLRKQRREQGGTGRDTEA